ncbi:hypothetical protein CEW91_06890 [Idiomarina piscisalsi]|uniref:diguanylate cyclase n=1 Tax=Idiomarina piscisalsi TaxID=1096243 RepID=A0ABM6LTI0_9GAMM|nr:hypothetical protein CEW91_06890 [Idiomarina piscisalsi]
MRSSYCSNAALRGQVYTALTGSTALTELTKEQLQQAMENCATEPVHTPDAIQPHGYFLAFNNNFEVLTHCSENIEALLGVSAEHLLGHSAPDYLKSSWKEHLLRLRQLASDSVGFDDEINNNDVYCTMYASGDSICVEVEPLVGRLSSSFLSELQAHQEQIRFSNSLDETLNALTKSIGEIIGFERVMVYKFDEEWNGQVIAELCKQSTIRRYLHQRFPASDIPKQVRELYSKNPLRSIVNSTQKPAGIIAHEDKRSLDLTKGVLRAVSPIHLTYMQNMGLHSSLSIAIFQEEKLWGLLSCHGLEAHPLNIQQRHAAQALVTLASQRLILQQQYETAAFFEAIENTRGALISDNQEINEPKALFEREGNKWLELFRGNLVALAYGNNVLKCGAELPDERILAFKKWLNKKCRLVGTFVSRNVMDSEVAEYFEETALRGVMAIALPAGSSSQQGWLMFFRPEQIEELEWAGRPNKDTIEHYKGKAVMSPRTSFESWKETIKGQSSLWLDSERKAAISLAEDLAIALSAYEVEILNEQLSAANDKLEHLVHTDALTQIWNRYHMEYVLDEQISAAKRYSHELGVILFDIDNFKDVNDNYGHDAGDAVLIGLSKLLEKELRDTDDFGRWGGEEFMIVAKHSDLEATVALAERLRQRLEAATFDDVGVVTASFGVTFYKGGESRASLVKRVDDALYDAKENGRNRVVAVE